MSNINQLATSNTFSQWLIGTQELISKMNSLTDGGNGSTFLSNTNIEIANNVTIGGNLIVSGNVTLDAIGFDDLIVAGGGTFGTTLDVAGFTTLANANTTGSLNVGSDLYVVGNTVFGGNVTLDNIGFNDLNVAGKLTVFGNTSLTNVTVNYGNFQTANVVSLVGSANTLIFNTITGVVTDLSATASYANSAFIQANGAFLQANTPSHVANSAAIYANGAFITANSAAIYANGAFIAANTAAADSLAFAIALG
jgi:hypothetical protein